LIEKLFKQEAVATLHLSSTKGESLPSYKQTTEAKNLDIPENYTDKFFHGKHQDLTRRHQLPCQETEEKAGVPSLGSNHTHRALPLLPPTTHTHTHTHTERITLITMQGGNNQKERKKH
jgi:hypothetical protein